MFRTILVPLDGSSLAEYAIPFAVEIARRTQGCVRLLRAMPESRKMVDIPLSIQASARKLAQHRLDELVKAYETPWVSLTAEVRIGFPTEEIRLAATMSDLIVMTTRGRGGIQRVEMGSVADRVIRLASRPVLAIHPPHERTRESAQAAALRMFRDVLVTLDGSAVAAQALSEVRSFADDGTRIHLVRVVAGDATPAVQALSKSELRDASSGLRDLSATVLRSVEKSDSPAKGIVDYALRNECGLIAMTMHGAGGAKRWILGDVTDEVLQHGPTPVLVIRASRELWQSEQRPSVERKLAVVC
ncbi:MAG: UspA domain-containing [Planctomycetota bacterium]|nr:MAG: UspA domain-containing [Planctomycetota bacterium]